MMAHVAQLVEHVLGKDEVTRSIRVVGSIPCLTRPGAHKIALGDRIDTSSVFRDGINTLLVPNTTRAGAYKATLTAMCSSIKHADKTSSAFGEGVTYGEGEI